MLFLLQQRAEHRGQHAGHDEGQAASSLSGFAQFGRLAGEKGEGEWARLMRADAAKQKIDVKTLEKFLGKRDRTDPTEWM